MRDFIEKHKLLFVFVIACCILGSSYFLTPKTYKERIAGSFIGFVHNTKLFIRNSNFYSHWNNRLKHALQNTESSDKKKDQDVASSTFATLQGTVRDESKKPIANAKVFILDLTEKKIETTTDKAGKYSIKSIPPGFGHIVATHPQHVAMMRPSFPFRQFGASTIDFTLPSGLKLNGLVTDEENKPIKNVELSLHHMSQGLTVSGGEQTIISDTAKNAKSDDKGAFVIDGVPIGELEVTAVRTGYEKFFRKFIMKNDNSTSQLNIQLKRPSYIAGQIRDAQLGTGVEGAKIILERFKPFGEDVITLDGSLFTTQSTKTGDFRINKLYADGFYDIRVEHPDFTASAMKLVPAGTENLIISISRGSTISGKACLIDRQDIPGVSVGINIQTVVKGTTITEHTVSDNTGQFSFTKLPFGNYKMWIDEKPYACVEIPTITCEANKPSVDNIQIDVYQICPVSGSVTSAEDGMPIGNAQVHINSIFGKDHQRSMKFTATTSKLGTFSFDRIPGGQHTATAEAKDYIKTSTGSSAESFALLPGDAKNDLALQLYKGGTVEGRVLDAHGSAVPKADVQLFLASTSRGNMDVSKLVSRSGDNGWYKIGGIDVGNSIQLYASARAENHAKGMSQIISLTAEKPSVTDADIQMPNGSAVQGRIMDENGLPISEARIRWSSGSFPGDPSPSDGKGSSESNGSYQLVNLPPGSISLNVSRSGYVSQSKGLTLKDNEVRAGVDFKLKTGLNITGMVMTTLGNPVANANVKANGLSGAKGSDSVQTDKDGRFTLGNLGEGSFRLTSSFSIKTPEGDQNYVFYLPSVKSGSEGVLIECDVDNSASTIVDAVGSGRRLQNFTFNLVSKENVSGQYFQLNVSRNVTNTNGLLKVSNIPLGIYSLTVKADGYETWKKDTVYVGPTRRTNLPPVHMEASGGIMGKIVSDKTGRPVSGVRVIVSTKQEGTNKYQQVSSGTSNYSGEFLISNLAPGAHRVQLSQPNYSPQTVDDIPVTRRKIYDMGTIILEAGGTIMGTVLDDTGNPCAGFVVTVPDETRRKTSTDRGGNYILQGITEGDHIVTVQGTIRGWRPVYTFGAALVMAGETVTRNFSLDLSANIFGQIFSNQYSVNAGGSVSLYPFDENSRVIDWIKYDSGISGNAFSINQIPAGQYFFMVDGNANGHPFRYWQFEQLKDGDNSLLVELSPSTIDGRILNASGAGTAQIPVQLRPIFNASFMSESVYNRLLYSVSTNAKGEFTLPFVQQGTYQLMYRPVGTWIASQTFSLGYGQSLPGMILSAP